MPKQTMTVVETIHTTRRRRVNPNDAIGIRAASKLIGLSESAMSRWVGTVLPEWKLVGPDGKEKTKRLTSKKAVQAYKAFLIETRRLSI